MPHGGSRPGSGRKPGLPDKIKAANATILAHAASLPPDIRPEIATMTPLAVMLRAMAIKANAGDWDAAAHHADKAAPYLHPKLISTDLNASIRRSAVDFRDDELIALARGDGREEGDGAEDEGA